MCMLRTKYALSDNAFHELTMISSDLPKSNQVKQVDILPSKNQALYAS